MLNIYTIESDFVDISTTITISPGDTSVDVAIPIIDDKIVEKDEVFDIVLQPQGNGVAIGNPGQAEVVIVSDDDCEFVLSHGSNSTMDRGYRSMCHHL